MPDLLELLLGLLTTSVAGNASVADILCSLTTPLAWLAASWLWYQAARDRTANEETWQREQAAHKDEPNWAISEEYRAAREKYLRYRTTARDAVVTERSRWYIAGLFVALSLYAAFRAPQAIRPELQLYALLTSLVILAGIVAIVHSALYSLFARRRLDQMIGRDRRVRPATLVSVRALEAELAGLYERIEARRAAAQQSEMQQFNQRLAAIQAELDTWIGPLPRGERGGDA